MDSYYQDELVTLYLGDCREVTEWLAADVLVTDPPYGVHHSPRGTRGSNSPVIAGEIRTGRAADRELGPEHVALRDAMLGLWGTRPAVTFGSWRAPRPARTQARLVWDKIYPGLGGVGPWRPSDEEIYLTGWPNPRNGSRDAFGTVIRHPPPRGEARADHPSPKPVGLMETLITACPPGVIADPFAGSGSTLVAARNLGRPAIGVEIEERYAERAASRLNQGVLAL
jgi:site-specific DNA-methyltransferase (adenine-specific)